MNVICVILIIPSHVGLVVFAQIEMQDINGCFHHSACVESPKQILLKLLRLSFNHPNPRGLGRNSFKGIDGKTRFNHPNPLGLGLGSLEMVMLRLQFQSSQPVRVWSNTLSRQAHSFGFQSSQPARVGSISMPILGCYCQVSIIPTREGWVK